MYRTTEMKQCYVCGNKPELNSYGCGWWVQCGCGQEIRPSLDHYSKGEAVAVWNYAQKTTFAVVKELEQLRYYDDEYSNKYESTYNEALNDCIEIVKRGGRNE